MNDKKKPKRKSAFEQMILQPGETVKRPTKQVGMVNHNSVRRTLSRIWKMNRFALKKFVENPDTPMGEIALASILVRAVDEGDSAKLNFLLDRLVGKAKLSLDKPEELDELARIPTEKLLELIESAPKQVASLAATIEIEKIEDHDG